MSEYIVEVDEEAAEVFVERFDWETVTLFGHHLVGEIVRCKGCKHYERMNDDEGMCMVPDDDGDYARWMVDADGYCYLGERREK